MVKARVTWYTVYDFKTLWNRFPERERIYMAVIVDRYMREQITHEENLFPISFFENELSELPDREGPLHWHPDFEIARAEMGTLEYQVGQQHILLEAGDSLLVNRNLLHSVRQVSGSLPDPLPIIVFSGSLIAPENSVIYQKYISPISDSQSLPFVAFRRQEPWCDRIRLLIDDIFTNLKQRKGCYEMAVQRDLSSLFESLFCHLETLPKFQETPVQLRTQIRVQKMLDYIYTHYPRPITIADIAGAANISQSEAGRSFHEYMDSSPVNVLIRYRLQIAHRMLRETSLTVQEIGLSCGFRSPNYFGRQFRKVYGCTPGQVRSLRK